MTFPFLSISEAKMGKDPEEIGSQSRVALGSTSVAFPGVKLKGHRVREVLTGLDGEPLWIFVAIAPPGVIVLKQFLNMRLQFGFTQRLEN
jgi:hypothetical protein